MNCLRCNGLAVRDDSFAVQTGSTSDFHGWRCINCGMIGDDVSNKNRRVSARQRRSDGSERRRYGRQAA
jgi:hypothetical protein